jgi:ABC-type Mn2+/Zn2+ transport system permease subunit
VLIGSLSRSGRVSTDSAIGIFMVASLAFGFLAQHIYREVRNATPQWFENLLFGHMLMVSGTYALASVMVSAAVVVTVAFLGKEILAYCFDPLTAETSGVPARGIHYTLMLLLAVVIVIGVRVAGSVLVTAMLVLPGATALVMSRTLRHVLTISIAVGLVGALAGISINRAWHYLPVGPSIVLVLFVQFVILYTIAKFSRGAKTASTSTA